MRKYQIWQCSESKDCLFTEDLQDDEVEELTDCGLYLVKTFWAKDAEAGKEGFIAWVREKQPEAQVEEKTQEFLKKHAVELLSG